MSEETGEKTERETSSLEAVWRSRSGDTRQNARERRSRWSGKMFRTGEAKAVDVVKDVNVEK